MIVIIDALNRNEMAPILDDMFRLRARVFGKRLGWKVDVRDGRECDAFDALDPAYLVGLDEEGHVVACVRLLQTTGPHMLSDVFYEILDGEPPLRSPNVWESTRFCVDTERLRREGARTTVSGTTCELMVSTLEYAKRSGIGDIVTVIDPVMDRVLKRSDCAPYGYLGRTVQMGKVKAMAAMLDCTAERIGRLRDYAGVEGDVFLSDERALALHRTSRVGTEGRAALLGYCREQIAAARTASERAAALALAERLLTAREMDALGAVASGEA